MRLNFSILFRKNLTDTIYRHILILPIYECIKTKLIYVCTCTMYTHTYNMTFKKKNI